MLIGYIILLVLGLISGIFLFKKLPIIKINNDTGEHIGVSIIIPARNEQENLLLLLNDLQKQIFNIDEIICVDDNSTDNTKNIIKQFDVDLIEVIEKPSDWLGKTWACQLGALHATGEILIFIDADVRMGKDVIGSLVAAYMKNRNVISVQPYHNVSARYEQFAFFFNMIGLGANGVGFPYAKRKAGLFGPIILINREKFIEIDGFTDVRNSIVEDVSMGEVLKKHSINYELLIGNKDLSFKMYPDFKTLFGGFSKNFASGAVKTPGTLLLLTFLWIQTITATPLLLLVSIFSGNQIELLGGLILYILIVSHMILVARKIGAFKIRYIIFYPVLLTIFHVVFFHSIYAKTIKKKVNWKGRDISL